VGSWRGKVIVSGHVGWGWEGGHYSDGLARAVYILHGSISYPEKGLIFFYATFVLF
jgi:hypothetical protein